MHKHARAQAAGSRRLLLPLARRIAATAASSSSDPPPAHPEAVMALPPPSVSVVSGASLATVPLDSCDSVPAAGTRLTQHLWAVLSLPDCTHVATAHGCHGTVELPPGSYQVGLLVLDDADETSIVLRNVSVAG